MGWDDMRQQARGQDMLTLEGCVEWSHPEQTRRETLLAELARLRAVEEAHAMLLRTVRGLPRPRPYYGSAIWHLDQALGDEATAAAPESACDKPRCGK